MPYEQYYPLIFVISCISMSIFIVLSVELDFLFKKPVTLGKIIVVPILVILALFAIPAAALLYIIIIVLCLIGKILTFPLIK